VPLIGRLSEGQDVVARVRNCEGSSAPSDAVPVIACRGVLRIGVKAINETLLQDFNRRGQKAYTRAMFRFFGIDVIYAEDEVLENLSGNPRYLMLDETDEDAIATLEARRNGLVDADIGVYVVEDILSRTAIPSGFVVRGGSPSVFIESELSGLDEFDVLAHEVGHVLGLLHEDDARWPTGNLVGPTIAGTSRIGNTALTAEELEIVFASRFIQPCGTRIDLPGCE